MLVNAAICGGIFFSGLMGLIIPLEDTADPTSIDRMKADQNWKIVWGISIVLEVFSIVAVLILIKSLSLKNLI